MSLITKGVGINEPNIPSDVRIVQWMLIKTKSNYNLFASCNIQENGIFDADTLSAIQELVTYRASVSNGISESNPTPNRIPIFSNSTQKPVILPDDANYKYLLKCTLKQLCNLSTNDAKYIFHHDAIIAQALSGTMNFQAFRNAVEARTQSDCRYGLNINQRIFLFGFIGNQEKMLMNAMQVLQGDTCANAFRRAKLPTPAEVVAKKGLLFVHYDFLTKPLRQELKRFGITEDLRKEIRSFMDLYSKTGGCTINTKADSNLILPSITGLYDHSFQPSGSKYPFNEIMPHEAIHRSGIIKDVNWFNRYAKHDLEDFDYYNDIITNCNCK